MAKAATKKTINRTPVAFRIPPELYAKIVKRAAAEHRNVTGMIVHALETFFKTDKP